MTTKHTIRYKRGKEDNYFTGTEAQIKREKKKQIALGFIVTEIKKDKL